MFGFRLDRVECAAWVTRELDDKQLVYARRNGRFDYSVCFGAERWLTLRAYRYVTAEVPDAPPEDW